MDEKNAPVRKPSEQVVAARIPRAEDREELAKEEVSRAPAPAFRPPQSTKRTLPRRQFVDRMLIPHRPIPTEHVSFPVVIYRGTQLTLAAPCVLRPEPVDQPADGFKYVRSEPPRSRYRSILLRKVSGSDKGSFAWEPTEKGEAKFLGLTAGGYDVYYLADERPADAESQRRDAARRSGPENPPHRRVLVEVRDHDRVSLRFQEVLGDRLQGIARADAPAQPRRLSPAIQLVAHEVGEPEVFPVQAASGNGMTTPETVIHAPEIGMIDAETEGAWELLKKGAFFNARRMFDVAICRAAKSVPSLARPNGDGTKFEVAEIVGASPKVVEAIRRSGVSHETVAEMLAEGLGRRPEAARMLHGIGHTYAGIQAEPSPIIDGAGDLAIVCFAAAGMLDERKIDSWNNAGVVAYRQGDFARASRLLARGVQTQEDPQVIYHLGRALLASGKTADARVAFDRAIERNPEYGPALVEWVHTCVGAHASALYPDECRAFAERLARIEQSFDKDTAEVAWARSALKQLEVLRRELAQNLGRNLVRPAGHVGVEEIPAEPTLKKVEN